MKQICITQPILHAEKCYIRESARKHSLEPLVTIDAQHNQNKWIMELYSLQLFLLRL